MRAVMPELPEPTDWLPYYQPSVEANWFTNFGPVNTQFEARLYELYGCQNETVVTAANATCGLSACLIAERISGYVLCPAFTFQATAGAILGAGCNPFVLDVDTHSGVVTPEILEKGFEKSGASAAIVIAPYGIKTDFKQHEALCREMGKLLIIDNAAGLGVPRGMSSFSGEGEVVREVYSLHATKPFGIGEGGAIFAPKTKAPAIRAALNFGLQSHTLMGDDQPPYWGINGKLSEVHAAIGMAVADEMCVRVVQRQAMAQRWLSCLEDSSAQPISSQIQSSPWQVFPIILESHAQTLSTIEYAAARGIELKRYYSPSLGDCTGMASLDACPNAYELSQRVVALPVRSQMTEREQYDLMASVRDCIFQAMESSKS